LNTEDRYGTGIQGTSLALSRVEGAPHKPFGLESLDLESFDLEFTTEGLETERLRAERFTPPYDLGIFDMPGVHKPLNTNWLFSSLKPASKGGVDWPRM
jgi:hypothetical protein